MDKGTNEKAGPTACQMVAAAWRGGRKMENREGREGPGRAGSQIR